MIINMTGGSGGGLNFKVVQYREKPIEPAKENTIAVVVPNVITNSVDWVMQAEQPEGVSGLIWIEVGTASDVAFYADKKQMVKLYPKSVQQFVDNSWVRREAYIYQSGWQMFSTKALVLYSFGNENESVTGGWTSAGKRSASNSSATATAPTITRGSETIKFDVSGTSNSGIAYCQNKIDLRDVSTLTVKGSFTSGGSKYLILYIWSEIGSYAPDNAVASETILTGNDPVLLSLEEYSLTSAEGYYIGFFIRGSSVEIEEMLGE